MANGFIGKRQRNVTIKIIAGHCALSRIDCDYKEKKMSGYEINFDGLVGLRIITFDLSFGNVASTKNRNNASNPKLATKQGLMKMKALADLGLKQGVSHPQERPHVPTLRRLGFIGSDIDVIAQAMRTAPALLSSLSSASSMWTNSCTVSPSEYGADGRVHLYLRT